MIGSQDVLQNLAHLLGPRYVDDDADLLAGRSVDYTGRYRGKAGALVRPGSAEEVAGVLRLCRDAGANVTIQGGRTSLVAGAVPHHDDVLISTERLSAIGEVDIVERRVRVGAGATLAAVQRTAAAAGLIFGVDLTARQTATVGGMASTNAGGLYTVGYGNMGEQVLGLQVALPDGTLLQRYSSVYTDNTGYNLPALFIGAEGTLGVITELELALQPIPAHRVTAVCGFADLADLVEAARSFRDADGIAALELIDARAMALTSQHVAVSAPVAGDWLLLVELTGDTDPAGRLAARLNRLRNCGEPAVGVDAATRQRLWRAREAVAEVLNVYGPPVKFDVSLPLAAVPEFAVASRTLVARYAPNAVPVIFGHIGEGNLHLNVLGCSTHAEPELFSAIMELIGRCGGNVSSEHGVGTLKRAYLSMARGPDDIAAMRRIKTAFDPLGYLNAAVLL